MVSPSNFFGAFRQNVYHADEFRAGHLRVETRVMLA
jgi:hypothetical protein